ncbi:MAG: hypothetical protein H0T59_00985 [Chloroflexi bacterium]|nr:hypothetical protein [Chloroflexota bacterium]
MTDPKSPDETFTWTGDAADASGDPNGSEREGDSTASASGGSASSGPDSGGTVLESLRDAIDDLAAMAGPAVRDISVRAAEAAAVAADRAAPLVRRVGDATAEASTKVADRSRTWASEQRTRRAARDVAGDGPVASPSHESDDPPPA